MNKKTASILCVISAGCLWGFMGVLVRRLNAMGLSPLEISFLRSLVTFVSMAAILLIADRRAFAIRLRDIWCFVGTGVISMASYNYFYFRTIALTSLSVAAVLMYTAPVFVVLMSALLFKERLSRQKILAAIVAFIGCAFVSGIVGGAGRISAVGLLCGLGSGFCYALYSIFSRYALMRGYSSATISLYTFFFALLASSLMADSSLAVATLTETAPDFMVTAFLILVVTLFPYLLYTRGLQGLENGAASILASVEPVVATLVGTFIFGERLGLWNAIGIVLVLFSIVLINAHAGKGRAADAK